MARPALPGPRDARGYVDLVLGRRDARAAHVILREHEHDQSIPAEVFASFWEQYDELEHLRERLALDETSRVVPTRPAHSNEEALSIISRAMDAFESHVESLSWAERRVIALSLEHYVALESHLSVIRPSLRDSFLRELYSAAQHVHEQVKLVCSSGGERLAFSHAEMSPAAVPLSPPVSSSSSHRAHHQLDVTVERTSGPAHNVHARLAPDGEGQGPPFSSSVARPDRPAEERAPQRRFRDEDEGWNYATLVYESDQAPPLPAGAGDSADARTAAFLPTDASLDVYVPEAAAPPAPVQPASVLAVADSSASPPEQHGEHAETSPAIRTDYTSSAASSSRLLASPGQPGGPTHLSRFNEELTYYNTWSRSSDARQTPVPGHAPTVVTSDVADEARHAEPRAGDDDVSAALDNSGEIDIFSVDCPDSAILDILVDTTPPVHTSRRQRESRAKNSTVAPSAVDELPAIPRMSSHISVADSDELPPLIPYKRFPPKTGRYQSNAPTMPRSSTVVAPPAGQPELSQAPAPAASGNAPLLPASSSGQARATTIPPEHSDTDADDTDSYNVVTDPEDNYTPAHFKKPTTTPAVRPASPRQGSSRIAPARLDANQCAEAAKRVHQDVLARFAGSGLDEVDGLVQFKNLGRVSAPAATTSWVRTGLARVGLSKKRSIVRAR